MSDMEVHGSCSDRFSAVQDEFADSLRGGADVGASVAVFLDADDAPVRTHSPRTCY
ncbi:hypothetical protein [Streptomyces sp. NPDC051173]